MKRWIVNAAERTVREARIETVTFKGEVDRRYEPEGPDEFLYDAPTYADAMAAGARRRAAEEALDEVDDEHCTVVADRIEPKTSDLNEARCVVSDLQNVLTENGWDVWREGTGLVVLGSLP